MPNTGFDLPSGIGLANDNFRAVFREFFSPKTALFSFFTKKIVKFLCLRKEEFRLAYLYNEEDCDCRYCLYDSKGKCKLQWCCCYQDKVRTCIKNTKRLRHLLSQIQSQFCWQKQASSDPPSAGQPTERRIRILP